MIECAYHIFDAEAQESDPQKAKLYEAARASVCEVLEEYGGADIDINSLSSKEWYELHRKLLEIKLTVYPDGEVVYG